MAIPKNDQTHFGSADYVVFRDYLQRACGIMLGDNKHYLIDSRLRKLLQDNHIASLSELVKQIDRLSFSRLRQQVIDAMTTNETLWFRDRHPFTYLQEHLLPELAKKPGEISIWCAACSSGQEPYSISICVEEVRKKNFSLVNKPVRVLATDISSKMLEQAKAGVYESLSLKRGMSQQRLDQHFRKQGEDSWVIKPELKRCIEFKPINLKDNFINVGRFDVVFCRNVLIYFSSELQYQIIRNIHRVLEPGGYLFLGGSETPKGFNDLFDTHYYTPGVVYIKK